MLHVFSTTSGCVGGEDAIVLEHCGDGDISGGPGASTAIGDCLDLLGWGIDDGSRLREGRGAGGCRFAVCRGGGGGGRMLSGA